MKKSDPNSILEELPLYKHKYEGQVQFRDVDSFGVVHNIQYLYYLEWARVKYLEYTGFPLNHRTFTVENPIMTVRHEIDYFSSALFTDNYEIFSRVTELRNSSLIFENIITLDNGKLIAKAKVVLVYLSTDDYKPARIPDDIREAIIALEGDNVKNIEN